MTERHKHESIQLKEKKQVRSRKQRVSLHVVFYGMVSICMVCPSEDVLCAMLVSYGVLMTSFCAGCGVLVMSVLCCMDMVSW